MGSVSLCFGAVSWISPYRIHSAEMTWRDLASTAADIGTALTGVAALFGVYGLWAWRGQKRRERQGDAAVRIHELVTRGADALEALSAPVYVEEANESQRRDMAVRFRRVFEEREKALAEDLEALDEASSIGDLMLDSVSTTSLKGLLIERRTIRMNVMMCAMEIEDGTFDPSGPEASGAWGPEVHDRIRRIVEEARHALRPLAQYHWSPLLSMVVGALSRRLAGRLNARLARKRAAPP
jgi:hypothetical protein